MAPEPDPEAELARQRRKEDEIRRADEERRLKKEREREERERREQLRIQERQQQREQRLAREAEYAQRIDELKALGLHKRRAVALMETEAGPFALVLVGRGRTLPAANPGLVDDNAALIDEWPTRREDEKPADPLEEALVQHFGFFRTRVTEVIEGAEHIEPQELAPALARSEAIRLKKIVESAGGKVRIERGGSPTQRKTIPRAVRNEVWERDKGRCSECGSKDALHYDHIIPLSKGGSNTARNLQLLCEKCNLRKGDRI